MKEKENLLKITKGRIKIITKEDIKMNTRKNAIVLISILIFALQMPGVMVMNDIICPFRTGAEKVDMNESIVEGAARFLSSQGYIMLACAEYERAELRMLDQQTMKNYILLAITEMKKARELYSTAKQIGEKIGYNEMRLQKFLAFDYEGFISAKNMNTVIATELKNKLVQGDIIAIHAKNIANVDSIIVCLAAIEAALNRNEKPDKAKMWELVELMSHATMYGNYATRIGREILEISTEENCQD